MSTTINVSNWIAGLKLTLAHGDGAVVPTDFLDDSRRVEPGAAFVARLGSGSDGRSFIGDALDRGATVIVAAAMPEDVGIDAATLPHGVTWVHAESVDVALIAELARRFFQFKPEAMKLIGVTGTNGKTTTAYLIQHLLQNGGVACGMIGTIVIDDGKTRQTASLTTPGVIDMVRALVAMQDNGCRAAVMEVSSHALHQGRVSGLDFDVAVFTNLTGDHLDYHETMDNYAAAKALLFAGLNERSWAVVNMDDANAARMLQDSKARVIETRVGTKAPEGVAESDVQPVADEHALSCYGRIVELAADHSRVVFDGPWGSLELDLPLIGRHNVANALQAVAVANVILPDSKPLRQGLASCPSVPGRLEIVRGEHATTDPVVLVDYAHTHDALDNVLQALRPLTSGRLICVFGCGGDRDKTKRPKMAAVASRWSDRVVITSDNPRTENPDAIIEDVRAGVPAEKLSAVRVEPDRAEAIAWAIGQAGRHDVVVIAGKGHEDYQIVGTTKRHFDDREQAAAVLAARRSSQAIS